MRWQMWTGFPRRRLAWPPLLALVLCLVAMLGPQAARAADDAANVQTVWRLLDYVAVDYGGAVAEGRVANDAEYAEMLEFVASAHDRIAGLPAGTASGDLLRQAEELRSAVAAKASPGMVAGLAHGLADALLEAYPVPLAPAAVPDPARGRPSMPSAAPPATVRPAMPTAPPRRRSTRRRSPSPTATAPASAASSHSIR